ncbi:RNase adapter RapZ [Rubeoparvulum massiliense]|uniref:RNase adapter RapZ n=1 Tax=Rubeoparvulum massiliense TaxID=1631346 RepID=UPI00065DEFE9|nr:RNase adapter RapZ [Rubeoparvulum massiliense]
MDQEISMVIITGMSGAGKTVAMQSLEDNGFYCIDNLPPVLIPKFAELIEQSGGKIGRVALVIDLRGRQFFDQLFTSLNQLNQFQGLNVKIVYLDASDQTLISRYKQTRRRHPLAPEGSLLDGIQRERKLLEELKGRANLILDTSRMKPLQLRERMVDSFVIKEEGRFPVYILSFGFKYGMPIDADLVFDVRFLPNPHYVDSLRPRTGKDPEVAEYVMKWKDTEQFLEQLTQFLTYLLPQYKREGKGQIVIAIGCTGGKHRSVTIADYLYRYYAQDFRTSIAHRDIEKE